MTQNTSPDKSEIRAVLEQWFLSVPDGAVEAMWDELAAMRDAVRSGQADVGRLREVLVGAVEAMTPLSNNPNGTAQRKCLYCRAWTIYNELMKHSPGCPFLLAQSALSAGED